MKQRFKTGIGAFVLCVVLLLAGALPVCAVKAHPVPDSGMTLDTSELLLELTSEDPAPVAYLTVQAPNDYFFLIWTSSAPSVASVDGTGKVTGHSEGTASITACNERGEKTACTVTVRKSTVARPVLNTTELALTITEQEPAPSVQLKLEQNDRGFIYVRQWVSSSPSVAQVSSSGTVTGQSSGRAVISALTTAGQVLRCTVTVTSEIGRVRISKNAMLLQAVGASQKLTAQAAGGKNTAMTWLSSNPDVAQVSTDGTVTAVGDGETVILAVSPEGRADACYVAVGTAAWRYRSEEELAEVCGVNLEEYRAYERGEKDFSFSFIYNAANRLGVDVVDLMSGDSPKLSNMCVVRKGKGFKINRREAYDYQHIAYTFRNKKVEPFVVTVEPKPEEEVPVLHEHEGQELNFVIEGSMEFYLGSSTTVLNAGDSVYFNSGIPHAMRALNGERVQFLAVVMGEPNR